LCTDQWRCWPPPRWLRKGAAKPRWPSIWHISKAFETRLKLDAAAGAKSRG
jgi:hypothetical protein